MQFLLAISLVVLYSRFVLQRVDKSFRTFFFASIPILIFLILFVGLQYDVGKDYFGYYGMVTGEENLDYIRYSGEMLFVYLIQISIFFKNPQLLFVMTATIQVSFLFLISYEFKKRTNRVDLFYLLYFILLTMFFNQFNLIRQFTAVYIVCYALIINSDGKYLIPTILIYVASLFHSTAKIFILFILLGFLLKQVKISKKFILISTSLVALLYVFDIEGIILRFAELIPQYSHYLQSDYFSKLPISSVVSKIPKVLILAYSLYIINDYPFDKKQRWLYNMGYISCILFLFSFNSIMIWRMYTYFDLFTLFPVLFYIDRSNSRFNVNILIGVLIIVLLFKILVFPSGEYLYKSVLF